VSEAADSRFAFGRNWRSFARHIDEERIAASVAALKELLQEEDLAGKRFLDIGCGSGLSSLAAWKLGAEVRAFDYDADSVATALALRERVGAPAARWRVEQGSALDEAYMAGLGSFDIVYSWGVLHHTGGMWRGIELAARAVASGGKLALAIYNDQGGASRRWLAVKKLYVEGPKPLRPLIVGAIGLFFEARAALIRLARRQNPLPFADWRQRRSVRGMSVLHDLVDWVGGYPFEVARPEAIFDFLKARGFVLEGMKTCGGGQGCNEFLFGRL
jgi:2-polyprenyl-6-hydroxyphenyl methylase/3-demethylubiquinone-9 3-methyltransferase